ncbi:MAG: hypothetical protein JWN76_2314 [Chitinophagaceae bacterium]|nr:hypothetical protein [Chitinophagaceae bacterium]
MRKILFIFCLLITFAATAQRNSLSYYINAAKANSPLLRDYRNQILSARLDSQILRASLKTQVNFIGSATYAPVFANGWGYDPALSNIWNITAIVQATHNFITKNNLAAQVSTLALQARGLQDTIRLSEQDLVKTITDQYITAYGDQLTMDFNREVLDLLKREDVILKRLTQASIYKQADYLAFYVTLQQEELTMMQSRIQYDADYLTLNYLAGINDTTIERVSKPDITDSIRTGLYESVFFQRYVTDSLRLANQKALIDFQYKPKIGAYADAGYMSSLADQPYKNFGMSMGISLNIPLYDGHQKQFKYDQLALKENTRAGNRDFFINQYRQQIDMLRLQLNAMDAFESKIQQQINAVHTLIEANERLLETGDIKITDQVLAINNYLSARNLLNQNFVSRLKLVSQINYWNR